MKKTSWQHSAFLLGCLWAAATSATHAQDPKAVRNVLLPNLDSQVRARLIALDRRLNPVHSPALAAAFIAQVFPPSTPLMAFTPILTDARNIDFWEQLPEEYYRLIQESGEALVTQTEAATAGGAWSSTQARRLCQQRLALLPRASLEIYRQRVDAEANALLEEGRRTRSSVPLRRIVDELFCSSVGDQALDLLGDLAFERGNFGEARYWWRLLAAAPGQTTQDPWLFPGSGLDLIRIRAKQVLAWIFEGHLDEAAEEIRPFNVQYPGDKGALAGQNDVYGRILQKTLDSFVRSRVVNNSEPWTTFGGDVERNRVLTQGLPWHLWEDGPSWHVPLPTVSRDGKKNEPLYDRGSLKRRAAFHPAIVNKQILIADHRSVISYDLLTGKEHFRFDAKDAGFNDIPPGIDDKIALPRFTLSVDHERAYVRLGKLSLAPKKEADKDEASFLVCLDIRDPEQKKPRLLWHIKASAESKAAVMFEGSPLVREGRVFIALSKVVGRRTSTAIVCYDLLGRQRWTREVCDCPEFEDNTEPRQRQHLLTWGGGQIIYCSHAGAIVAIDASTGQPTWAARYPTRGAHLASAEPSPRDLTPCLYSDGLVFAAPLDSDRLYCLNAVTGQVQWELESVELVHLLGAARGRLLMSTRTGVQAVSIATGQIDWKQPTEGRLPGLGRGLIAGSWLLWPTTDARLPYRGLTIDEGEQQRASRTDSLLPEPSLYDPTLLSSLPVGNLAFGEGCLAIAGLDELSVFVPPAKMPKIPEDLLPRARIESLYHQARDLACAGEPTSAARVYLELLDQTRTDTGAASWRTLIDNRLQLLTWNSRVAEPTDADAERSQLRTFTDPRMPPSATLRALTLQRESVRVDDPLAICKRILRSADLREAWLPGIPPIQGRAWALQEQKRLARGNDKDLPYLGDDDDVATLFAYLRNTKDGLKQRELLVRLADGSLQEGRPGRAADVYRRLLALPVPGPLRLHCLLGLARAYEAEQEYRSAWECWTRMKRDFADAVDPVTGKALSTLFPDAGREPFRSALAPRQRAEPALPLVQSWSERDGGLCLTEQVDDDCFFCMQDGGLTCRLSLNGVPRWRQKLDFTPNWFGRWHDLVLIAGADAVRALRVEDGGLVWAFPAPSRMVRAGSVVEGRPGESIASAGFVACQRWKDTLVLLDAHRWFYRLRLDTGEPVWRHASPAAAIYPLGAAAYEPFFLPSGQDVLAQTSAGQPTWLGAMPIPMGERVRPWIKVPVVVANRIILAGERGRIEGYDASTHALRWTYKATSQPSLTGEPCRLFSREDVLLALVPRNDGAEWLRLNPSNGQVLWHIPAIRTARGVDLGSVGIGDTSWYYVCSGRLYARSLNDGAVQWKKPLSSHTVDWQVRYTPEYLAVHPADSASAMGFGVALVDPLDGTWLESLTFPEERGPVRLLTRRGTLLVSVGRRIFGFRSLGTK